MNIKGMIQKAKDKLFGKKQEETEKKASLLEKIRLVKMESEVK